MSNARKLFKATRNTSANLTMADIAKAAGVSKITVSRALSNHPLVKDSTKARIRDLALEKGYRLNVAARNLRLQRTHMVAVVVEMTATPTRPMSEPYPLALLGGIIQELTSCGYNLVLSTAETFVSNALSVDAVILLGQGVQDDAVSQIAAAGLPMVVWGSVRNDMDHVIVGSDNIAGGVIAAARLLSVGRRRLAYLGDIGHAEIADRFDGFCQRLSDEGVKPIGQRSCAFTFAGGHDAMADIIAEHGTDIDGVFACSDPVAMGAIRALTESGRHVPDQVSVVGFDDSPGAAFFIPALTTVHQDWHKGGRLLAHKALDLIDGHHVVSERLPVSLVIRTS
jgi:DNA-binding LacI/PurR family transcriptional regulator